jgi:hypothetical protein
MRMIPPNTGRRAGSTPAVAVAVERAGLRRPAESIQISAHKRQVALVNASKSTSVYFLESGLFNGLRPIQIAKIRSKSHSTVPWRVSHAAPTQARMGPPTRNRYSTDSGFMKQIIKFSAFSQDGRR